MKNGKNKNSSKSVKPSKKNGGAKATAKKSTKHSKGFGDRRFIFGHSVASVARALGRAGAMPSGAIAAIHKYQPLHSPAAIRSFVQAGKSKTRGTPAALKKTELSTLMKIAKAATA